LIEIKKIIRIKRFHLAKIKIPQLGIEPRFQQRN